MKYHVIIQGFNANGDVNDYTKELAIFDTFEKAEKFVENSDIKFPSEYTEEADLIIESRDENDNFIDLLFQTELNSKN